jgi:hypothetical protein
MELTICATSVVPPGMVEMKGLRLTLQKPDGFPACPDAFSVKPQASFSGSKGAKAKLAALRANDGGTPPQLFVDQCRI